jgi:hypothetical protein
MKDAAVTKCAENAGNCKCEFGGTIIYGEPTEDGRTVDITKDHWELDAPSEGTTKCFAKNFGTDFMGGYCFCELAKPPKHDYCHI